MASTPASAETLRRTPREKGMDNMLAATVGLLIEKRPDDVTERDVAAAAGQHHRFVQAWFGGKVGLFLAAFDRMSTSMAASVSPQLDGGSFDERALALARLLNWLIAADPDSMSAGRQTPLIDRMSEIYVRNSPSTSMTHDSLRHDRSPSRSRSCCSPRRSTSTSTSNAAATGRARVVLRRDAEVSMGHQSAGGPERVRAPRRSSRPGSTVRFVNQLGSGSEPM